MSSATAHAQALLDYIDTSPSPWHAVNTSEKALIEKGFSELIEGDAWSLERNGRYYVKRDDSSIIAFTVGTNDLAQGGFRLLGAHTDSPGLRVKPKPDNQLSGINRLGVEVYGGALLATFTDRDLSLAGRVHINQNSKLTSKLVHFKKPFLRLPNLAIHMNPKVNTDGLKLNKQTELPLLLSVSNDQPLLIDLLAAELKVDASAISAWELHACDTQAGTLYGLNDEFYANSQLDNLASCHAGLSALLSDDSLKSNKFNVCAFFDHEEIGSNSHKGADGSFLPDVLERIAGSLDMTAEDYKRALSNSFMISADMAHAYQPNFPSAYEPDHKVLVNQGPVIKVNANIRYASNSASQSRFIQLCEQADVPYQQYSHRTDIGCGSTIGPMTSARLGINTVDVGCPMWAMHSIRESAGVQDHQYITQVFTQFFS
ncbi:MAG TPA: M18 family aminopeptidase [Cycloclasticus sp.]|jgi:aspartyl aminopeptidase|nr:M18 family aminopeptidase [Cycloclasticus sp.]HIL93162.1 M18 family aminopeptidase [Cycloclasticus sp.]